MSLSIGRPGRLILWTALLLTFVALLLGRYAPPERQGSYADHRTAAFPRYLAVPVSLCSAPPYVPRIVDTQTSAITRCSVKGAGNLDFLGCSPWRDRAGQHHMAALYRGGGADQPERLPGPIELVRYAFPAGTVVDRAIVDPLPRGSICWAPDRSDRIVFAACDGRLYRYDFSEGDAAGNERGLAQPVRLRWKGKRRRHGRPWFQDPCWPNQPALRGHLLASVMLSDPEGRQQRLPNFRLCWVRPDSDLRNILETRQAIDPDGVSPDTDERLPSVGRAADGTLRLAYLIHAPARARWELWVAPLAVEPSDGNPRVLASERQRLADECAPAVPAFSPDGRWIFAAVHDARSGVRTRRFRVPGSVGGLSDGGTTQ
jgi:hypothetical protein